MISIFKIRMLPINPAKLKIYMKVHNIIIKSATKIQKKLKSIVLYSTYI